MKSSRNSEREFAQGIQTISPINGEVYVTRSFSTDEQIAGALDRSRRAQEKWRFVPLVERVERVHAGVRKLFDRSDEYQERLTWQMGRPISQVAAEFSGMMQRADHMSNIAADALSANFWVGATGTRFGVQRDPLGVVLAITPWNYPYLTAINTVVAALVSGNTMILKPSPQTPLVGEEFDEAFTEAGLPAGVFQCLHLSVEQVLKSISDKEFDHVAFTGSVENGASVEKAAAGNFTSIGLELGGKDAAYVRPDADISTAAEQLASGAFYNAGQSCCAIERIYLHSSIYDEFVDAFGSASRAYRLGDPLDASTTLGPVVSDMAATRIREVTAAALVGGARSLLPQSVSSSDSIGSTYLVPQALLDVTHDMTIMKDETFGPVVGIMRVSNDDEAVALMNDSPFGLTASFWSEDAGEVEDLASKVKVGTVYLNKCDALEPSLPWSGVGNSGKGCTLSKLGFDALTRAKALHLHGGAYEG